MQIVSVLLLVEDEAAIQLVVHEVLEEAGYAVVQAYNGDEAIRLFDERRDELQGLIIDVELGDGPTGWDVARHAREIAPSLPVIYMSAGLVTTGPRMASRAASSSPNRSP